LLPEQIGKPQIVTTDVESHDWEGFIKIESALGNYELATPALTFYMAQIDKAPGYLGIA
jgi:hypothetical protein